MNHPPSSIALPTLCVVSNYRGNSINHLGGGVVSNAHTTCMKVMQCSLIHSLHAHTCTVHSQGFSQSKIKAGGTFIAVIGSGKRTACLRFAYLGIDFQSNGVWDAW